MSAVMLRTRSGLLVPPELADEGAHNPPQGIHPTEWRTLRTKPHDYFGLLDQDRADRARVRSRERDHDVVRRLPGGVPPEDLGPLTDDEYAMLERGVSGGGAERIYQAYTGVAPTTAALVVIPTNAALKTCIQIATAATAAGAPALTIIEWGVSFDGAAAATPGKVEFFNCTGAASGLTTLNAADIIKYNNPGGNASSIQLGTALSGFNATTCTEGTVANWRGFDNQLVAPTNQYVKQWPLSREPEAATSTFLRIRVTFGSSVNMYGYITWTE